MRSRNRHLYGPRSTTAGGAAVVAVLALGLTTGAAVGSAQEPAAEDPAKPKDPPAAATVRIDPRNRKGGDIPTHFVGFSIEWTLIERYMGPNARRGFANLLGNLETGVLRIGGGSQDNVPFDAGAANTNRVITPEDLASIRATLDLTNGDSAGGKPDWGTILGTGTAPQPLRPVATVDNARRFTAQGVDPSFSDAAGRRALAGIELGNEPDLNYPLNPNGYLSAFVTYSRPDVTKDYPVIGPNTSEQIGPWQKIADGTAPGGVRFFHHWPAILDTEAPIMKERPGGFGVFATDHFYPLARTCPTDPYRCPTIERLLSDERMANFDYEVYTHAAEAARHDLGYRIEETSTAAGRGAPGVSNVAASGIWALDTLFNAACPQPPNAPGANQECGVGATGLNLHNAEVRAFFFPEEGNAYYNAVNYDPTPNEGEAGSPTATPGYYAMLLFAKLAQGTDGLRPVAVDAVQPSGSQVKAWQVSGERSERRLFLINKGQSPVTLNVEAPGSRVELDRMTPHDPTGAGRTLDAAEVRIDGHAIGADGSWPGLDPTVVETDGGRVPVTVGPAEAVVVTLHGHDE
jgi:hypothetical protein